MNASISMQAMATQGYGPLEDLAPITIPLPVPGRNEVRVRIHSSALNPADYKVILGRLKIVHGRTRPLIVGYDFSGVVEACGPDVTAFPIGQEVFGFLPYSMSNKRGAFAEAVIARVDEVAAKPPSVSHEQAAAVATAGAAALQSLRDLGRLRAGQRVLITGASGGVGLLAVAIARRLGASVTAVGSGRGLELAQALGAEALIDRKQVDPLQAARGPFDVVFDTTAMSRWRAWKKHLRPGGAFVTTLPSMAFFVDKLASLFSTTRAGFLTVKSRPADLQLLAQWLADGMHVQVDHVVGIRDIATSLAKLERGGILGRIVVAVKDKF